MQAHILHSHLDLEKACSAIPSSYACITSQRPLVAVAFPSQVAARDAANAANKAARVQAADNIYQKLKLEQEAAIRAKVGGQRSHGLRRLLTCIVSWIGSPKKPVLAADCTRNCSHCSSNKACLQLAPWVESGNASRVCSTRVHRVYMHQPRRPMDMLLPAAACYCLAHRRKRTT